jgi:ribonuclease D
MFHCHNTLELKKFCEEIENQDYICVDTEFSRDKTYYPLVCLIQIATQDKAILIDPLNKNIDLSVLDLVMQNPNIVKVFHSAKQDLEILNLTFGHLPRNIFDTQVAASFIGMGDSISYESMVFEFLGKTIDKTHCLSDWTRRPLSEEQIDYALADVTYLYKIYPLVLAKLKENHRLEWVLEEMDYLLNPEQFLFDVDKAWQKIKNTQGIKMNLVLMRLASWREKKAQENNIPRNHFLHENHLIELVSNMPITDKELRDIDYFEDFSEKLSEEIVEVIRLALNDLVESDLLDSDDEKNNNLAKFKKLKSLLNKQAEKYSIPPRIIATSQELKDISRGNLVKSHKIFKGWRSDIFGQLISK